MDVTLFVTRHQALVKEPRHFHFWSRAGSRLKANPGSKYNVQFKQILRSSCTKKNTIRKIVKEKETCSNIIQTVRDLKTLGSRMARGKGLRGELCGVRDIGSVAAAPSRPEFGVDFPKWFLWVNISNSQTRILVDNCFEFVHHVPGVKKCGRMNRTHWTSYNSTHSILRCKRLKTHQQFFSTTGQIGALLPEIFPVGKYGPCRNGCGNIAPAYRWDSYVTGWKMRAMYPPPILLAWARSVQTGATLKKSTFTCEFYNKKGTTSQTGRGATFEEQIQQKGGFDPTGQKNVKNYAISCQKNWGFFTRAFFGSCMLKIRRGKKIHPRTTNRQHANRIKTTTVMI